MVSSRQWVVTPDMPPRELRSVWSEAVDYARANPGAIVTIEFAFGTYPLPSSGAVAYETGTVLKVGPPGSRVTITYLDNAGLSVTTTPQKRSA
jgi:hypothetical protein